MKTLTINDATPTTRNLIQQAETGPILLRDERGRTFLLAEVDESEAEALALGNHPQLFAIIEQSRARAEREGWLTTEQLREQLGL